MGYACYCSADLVGVLTSVLLALGSSLIDWQWTEKVNAGELAPELFSPYMVRLCWSLVLLCVQSQMSSGAGFLLCLVYSQVALSRQSWSWRTGSEFVGTEGP